MKKNKKKKAIVLSLGMAMLILSATNLNAQKDGSRGLFGKGFESTESNRNEGGMEWSGGGMTPKDPTQETPLSGGVMLLAMAGAGYALVKSRNGKEEQR